MRHFSESSEYIQDSPEIEKNSLLIEFLTEELPPINIFENIGSTFANALKKELSSFIIEEKIEVFISPRRFGCIMHNIANKEKNQKILRKGPSIESAIIDNQPSSALLGFLKSCNLENWQELEQKGGYFYYLQNKKGRSLDSVLIAAINYALKQLPIPKNMRWGNNNFHFIRPVHNLIIMYGNQVICNKSSIFDLHPVNWTLGHREMSSGKIIIKNTNEYNQLLKTDGFVIADFIERRELIKNSLEVSANKLNLQLYFTPELLDEVTAIVEYPIILQGEFNKEFLEIPQECLILSMSKNQKYFALLDKNGRLTNKFLFVSNIASLNPETVISGNQKVLSARLADAKFFYDVDKKHTLDEFVEKLSNVIYHNKLGSQLERITRLQTITDKIAKLFDQQIKNIPSPEIISRSTQLLKADLTTEMVGEFPELQGIMGKYYALHNGEKEEVANAIEQHYYPRFSKDKLPSDILSQIMALGDKIETIVGIWGIGLIPTGEKDPFALRRHALGIIRILLLEKIDITKLISLAYEAFINNNINISNSTPNDVFLFILKRLEQFLITEIDDKYSNYCVKSIIATNPKFFHHIPSLLKKLQLFAANKNNQPLLTANKRIHNILAKNGLLDQKINIVDPNFLKHDIANKLLTLLQQEKTNASKCINTNDWDNYFLILSKFNEPITKFFDSVMVMDNDKNIRDARIFLLQNLYAFLNSECLLLELE